MFTRDYWIDYESIMLMLEFYSFYFNFTKNNTENLLITAKLEIDKNDF